MSLVLDLSLRKQTQKGRYWGAFWGLTFEGKQAKQDWTAGKVERRSSCKAGSVWLFWSWKGQLEWSRPGAQASGLCAPAVPV